MKTITCTLALALGLVFSATAFAADVTTAKTKAECNKAGGRGTRQPRPAKPRAVADIRPEAKKAPARQAGASPNAD